MKIDTIATLAQDQRIGARLEKLLADQEPRTAPELDATPGGHPDGTAAPDR